MKARYFHERFVDGSVITACVLQNGIKTIAIGRSVCSPEDNFCRRTGREMSFYRAMIAAVSEENDLPMQPAKLTRSSIARNLLCLNKTPLSQYVGEITLMEALN